MVITSRTNPIVKTVRTLHRSKGRAETGLHFIEGDKLVRDAAASGAVIETVFAVEGTEVPSEQAVVFVSESVMEAMATVQTPQTMAATVITPPLCAPDIYPNGLIVALDRIQDPGNLGTILRTADALGASAVLLSEDSCDPFSPKALRAAMGSTYHLPIFVGQLCEQLDRLNAQGYQCICGHLSGEEQLPKHQRNTVIVIGNEGNGVSESVAERCIRYRMPMRGRAESLNAAVFGALMMQQYFWEEGRA